MRPAEPVRIGSETYSLGSVIFPVRADAAVVSGEARYTPASLCPILPGKFLFVVLIQMMGSLTLPKVSAGPPRHAAQPEGPSVHPASCRICSIDFSPGCLSSPWMFRRCMSA